LKQVMIEIQIPGFGEVKLSHLVCDYSGTLSVDGIMLEALEEKLNRLSKLVDIHVITADTHGRVESELVGVKCKLVLLTVDIQKLEYIEKLGAENVVAIGNGNNDRKMLAKARIGIAVCMAEGLSTDALKAATIMVNSPMHALDLLIYPKRLVASLRL
jgi:soluble P-type ATPase